jgi:hypothetical protein
MNEKHAHAALLREVYRDLVLSLGTILSLRLRLIPEEMIGEICRCIRNLYRRHRNRYAEPVPDWPPTGSIRPHPELLRLLKDLGSST